MLGAASALADVVFSNFGPGDSYDTQHGWSIGAGASGPGFTHLWSIIANPFEVATDNLRLEKIELAASLGGGPNELDISLTDDAGDAPGTTIEAFHVSGAMGRQGPPVVVRSKLHPLLSGSAKYWVVASITNPDTWATLQENFVGDTVAWKARAGSCGGDLVHFCSIDEQCSSSQKCLPDPPCECLQGPWMLNGPPAPRTAFRVTATSAVCGDAITAPDEQCDDG